MSARTHEIPPQIVAIATAAAILQEINAILDAAGIPDLVGEETPADRVRKLAAMRLAAETVALLDTLRDLHGDDVLVELYSFDTPDEVQRQGEFAAPLEEAVYAWAAAGYPDAPTS